MGWLGRIGGVLAMGLVLAAAGDGGAVAVAARRAGMHRAGAIMRALRDDVLAGRDVAPLQGAASEILDWSERLATLFPPGSESGDTYANGTVWTDRAEFEVRAARLAAAARRMLAVAREGDRGGFAAAYRATAAACGSCHRDFRRR